MSKREGYIIVNFGGPRDLQEVEEFLIALLTDQDVIQTSLPSFLHRLLFSRVAKKRAKTVVHDYAAIGGKSPIYGDTESIAKKVGELLGSEVVTFHRYLPKTHSEFIEKVEAMTDCDVIRVFPLFPQFSYTTTGSIARWFSKNLSRGVLNRLHWIKSYPADPLYLNAFAAVIAAQLEKCRFLEDEVILLFSAHGLPQRYVQQGDVYERECRLTFRSLAERFPKALSQLSYQSQFGKELWLKPATDALCAEAEQWSAGRKKALIIPLSFTSDHIETLFEVEEQYLPVLQKKGIEAVRCPALNLNEDWIEAISQFIRQEQSVSNQMLVR